MEKPAMSWFQHRLKRVCEACVEIPAVSETEVNSRIFDRQDAGIQCGWHILAVAIIILLLWSQSVDNCLLIIHVVVHLITCFRVFDHSVGKNSHLNQLWSLWSACPWWVPVTRPDLYTGRRYNSSDSFDRHWGQSISALPHSHYPDRARWDHHQWTLCRKESGSFRQRPYPKCWSCIDRSTPALFRYDRYTGHPLIKLSSLCYLIQ